MRLGISPEECLVVEDAEAVSSGLAAGMSVLLSRPTGHRGHTVRGESILCLGRRVAFGGKCVR